MRYKGKTLLEVFQSKVENILKGSLDSIPSPLPSVKIQIMGEKGGVKEMVDIVNKLLKTKKNC